MAANEGVTKVIASFYRVDLDVVFLGLSYYLRPNIVPANFFWVFTLSWPGFSETFRLLPQISVDFAKTSERCRQCPQKKFRRGLRTTKVILKTTILTCFNFVRTQKSTPSKSSFNAFLDWIFIIYHVLRKHFVRICESGVRNCPSCVRSMSLDSLVHRRETYA